MSGPSRPAGNKPEHIFFHNLLLKKLLATLPQRQGVP